MAESDACTAGTVRNSCYAKGTGLASNQQFSDRLLVLLGHKITF